MACRAINLNFNISHTLSSRFPLARPITYSQQETIPRVINIQRANSRQFTDSIRYVVSLPRRSADRRRNTQTRQRHTYNTLSASQLHTMILCSGGECVSRERRRCRSRALCQSDACICARGAHICMPQTYTPPLGAIATPSAS